MSLKAIHIVFIIASMLLCVGFGAWAVDQYSHEHGTAELCYAIGSGVVFVTLAVYGWYFLKKLKKISYL
jgi:multidrug transporter EmrE-like cation transporter